MKYLLIPVLAVFLAGTNISCRKKTSEAAAPNIVVVLVDDWRWDEFGAAGHNFIKTPNIDRVVREGGHFVNAFSTTPLCSPSRASFLTGQYAHNHGIIDNTERSEQSHKLKTYPAILDSLGYETAFIGKWHMGNDNTPRKGFDFWAVLKGQGEANDPELNLNGQDVKKEGYVTDILTGLSLDFLRKERKSPFLLYISHKGLHPNMHQRADGSIIDIGNGGFVAAERHKGLYRNDVFKRRPNAFVTPADKPALMRKIGNLPDLGRETATPEDVIRGRSEMLMAIDEGLGQIMDELEKNGELDNTMIVLAGDHGYWYGEHGLNEERRLAYEEGIRIPLLVRYPPRVAAGSKFHQMVLSLDVAPTAIELAGAVPESYIDGRSLTGLFDGTAGEWRKDFFIEYYTDKVWPRAVNLGYKAVRTERYKYIRYTDLEGVDEFYDLEKDPYELHNAIGDAVYAEIIGELKKSTDRFF